MKQLLSDSYGTTKALTAGQRCADWFVTRAHRCTGTMARFVSSHDVGARSLLHKHGTADIRASLPTNEELVSKFRESWYSKATSTDEMRQGTKTEVSGRALKIKKLDPSSFLIEPKCRTKF